MAMRASAFLIMGVAGCGKTTIGRLLAERLGWEFLDADDFHPPANIAKMRAGMPLDDSDRAPWLSALNEALRTSLAAGRHPVLACSSLKESYREVLRRGVDGLRIVYLKGDYTLLWSRLAERRGHYMKPAMLRSQFEALEEPSDALVVDVRAEAERIADSILAAFAE
jgi:gluconokinase